MKQYGTNQHRCTSDESTPRTIQLRSYTALIRAHSLCVGYPPPSFRLCTRHKRPRYPPSGKFSLEAYISDPDIEFGMDPGQLPKPVLDAVEADSFWCLTKLLDGIQDNYIFAQPGIQRQVASLRDLTTRIDAGLAKPPRKRRRRIYPIQFQMDELSSHARNIRQKHH